MRLRKLSIVLLGSAIAFATAATIALPLDLGASVAIAKQGGNGNGNGGGNSGGNGGNNGNGGGSGGGGSDSNGGGSDNGNGGSSADAGGQGGRGNSSTARDKGLDVADDNAAADEELLGALGASNASATARAHASEKSAVGQLAAYESYVAEGNWPAAAASLKAAANQPVTLAVLQAVNANLGLVMDEGEVVQILDILNQ